MHDRVEIWTSKLFSESCYLRRDVWIQKIKARCSSFALVLLCQVLYNNTITTTDKLLGTIIGSDDRKHLHLKPGPLFRWIHIHLEKTLQLRKPYTITKQRERWTEDEHNRFLEAIKLYGRAWQRIEEHLGTKTAVQIRSHAQKFFTKLEKEAIVKGVPIGQSLDIEIPPPRPKRKPHNPYPRKTTVGTPASSSCREKESEKPCDHLKFRNINEYHDKDNHPEAFCESPSSAYKVASVSDAPKISCSFRQYVPHSKEPMHQDETATSQVTTEAKGYQMEKSDAKQPFHENFVLKISDVVDPYPLQEKSVHSKKINELQQSENSGMADVHSCHAPLQILDGSSVMRAFNISPDMAYAESIFRQTMDPESSVHHSFPTYHPAFSPVLSQDDCQSFLHVSTAFSSLTVSALLQNPAAITRPSLTVEQSTASAGGFESRPLNTNPSMAAIAAATVAAATAWWEAHGLLPFSAPSHPAFPCSPPSPSATPMACRQDRAANRVRRETSHDPAMNLKAALPNPEMAKVEVTTAELQSTNKKLVERSSCGSNTSSSSEVEGDALEKHIEEKDMKEKEEQEEVDPMHLLGDPFGRRCRSTSNGRIAFDALFSREILPQSFLPHKGKAWSTCSSLICGSIEDGPLNMGLGVGESKVKANRTGFKPYKRCSVEAKDEEKCPKRLRLQGDPSTS